MSADVPPAPRVALKEPTERLFRQILLPLRDRRPSWEVFKGRKNDDWQVSVDRQSLCATTTEAHARYTSAGANSYGVLATSVESLDAHSVAAYEEPKEDNPAHCEYDLKTLATGEALSHSRREKICIDLFERALADDGYPPYLPE